MSMLLDMILTGSPPHTWGILLASKSMNFCVRITPTYMGNTNCSAFGKIGTKDHPHIHGEYHDFVYGKVAQLGITPTYMGNTFGGHFSFVRFGDHPHIHGEYYWEEDPALGEVRITPTYMGNTKEIRSNGSMVRDHPHIHGEYYH